MSDSNNVYIEQFAVAFKQNLLDMAGVVCKIDEPQAHKTSLSSQGIAVIIGITGKRHGRIIIDTNFEVAKKISELINEETGIDKQLIIDTIAEFANIVCGHTITLINNSNKEMNLMLTPPSVFLGSKVTIVSPKINAQLVAFDTELGNIAGSVGFEGVK